MLGEWLWATFTVTAACALFALSAVCYRGGIQANGAGKFIVAASTTLALIEIRFAQIASRRRFKQHTSRSEAAGIALLVLGVVLILRG